MIIGEERGSGEYVWRTDWYDAHIDPIGCTLGIPAEYVGRTSANLTFLFCLLVVRGSLTRSLTRFDHWLFCDLLDIGPSQVRPIMGLGLILIFGPYWLLWCYFAFGLCFGLG